MNANLPSWSGSVTTSFHHPALVVVVSRRGAPSITGELEEDTDSLLLQVQANASDLAPEIVVTFFGRGTLFWL